MPLRLSGREISFSPREKYRFVILKGTDNFQG
jgi:hypothetical protein